MGSPRTRARRLVSRRGPQSPRQLTPLVELAEGSTLERANASAPPLALPHAAPAQKHRDELIKPLQLLGDQLTEEHVRRWRQLASSDQRSLSGTSDNMPDSSAATARGTQVLLTGIPRSGTTLLMKLLSEQLGILACDECDAFARWIFPLLIGLKPVREVTFAQLDALPEAHLDSKCRLYARFLESALGVRQRGQMILDKNPSLLPLLPFYHRMLPNAPILVMHRDPRDLLVSNLMTFFPLNDFSVDFLDPQQGSRRIISELTGWHRQRPAYGSMCT